MPNIVNGLGQVKVGVKPTPPPPPSTLMSSIYSAYNADSQGLTSLKTSLVAVYNGESNTNDSFGSNNGNAVGGLTYTIGKIGNAFDFNGTNAYVSIPNTSGQLDFTGDFSISTWVMPLVTSVSYVLYFSNFLSSGSGYNFYLDRTNNTLQLYMAGGGNYSRYQYSWTPLVNTWYHLVLARKGSTGTKFYINGAEVVGTYFGQGATFNPSFQSGQIYNIGGTLNGQGLANYRQDATTIWNKTLTQSEITELYNSGNGSQYITDNFYKPTTNDALNLRNGTAQGGLTYGVGKVGTAFQFNGTNAYVNMGDVMDIGTSSWSYSMWFNVSQTGTYVLFSKSIAAQGTGRIWATIESNSKLGFNFSTAPSYPADIYTESTTTINTNTWYHVVFILDRSDKLKMYINGSLETITTPGTVVSNNLIPFTSVNYNNNNPFRIGSYTSSDNTTPLALFNGRIDTFNVWNKVLTQSEITELYNSGNGKQYPF